MKSSVEPLEGNKVKVIVNVSAEEFEIDLDAAFKRLAGEVRLPGFRPGKAPRKVLEARIGSEYARGEAFEKSLPRYYSEAARDNEVDVIAPPDIDITEGREDGPVTFEAIVQIRPQVSISGYKDITVEVKAPGVDDEEVAEAERKFLAAYGDLVDAERPAEKGDTISMRIAAEQGGEPLPGLTADDYSYTLGSGSIVPELDDELIAAEPGDEFDFAANHPDPDEEDPLRFSITVHKVQRVELPEATPEFMQQNSEFETIEEFRTDYVERMSTRSIETARQARTQAVFDAVAELVPDEDLLPELVELEVENRIEDMSMRMQAQGMRLEQFIQMTGQSVEQFVDGLRATADSGAKLDLALRAIVEAEGLHCTDEELTDEVQAAAEAMDQPADEIRQQYSEAGLLPKIRWDLSKRKATDFILEHAVVNDLDGKPLAADVFDLPETDEADTEEPEPSGD